MKLVIVAVGQKMPDWAQTAVADYAKRFTNDLRLEIKTVKAETRTGQGLEAIFKAERTRIEGVLQTLRNPKVVVLDERGAHLTTLQLASKIKDWQLGGDDIALIVGGPDGLEPAFKKTAHEQIKLSDLTLPHAMARLLLTEALYRAWSVNAGHPYHRE